MRYGNGQVRQQSKLPPSYEIGDDHNLEPPDVDRTYTRAELNCRTEANTEEGRRACSDEQTLQEAHEEHDTFNDRS